jgi:SOS-response transcriptional repressor LexA
MVMESRRHFTILTCRQNGEPMQFSKMPFKNKLRLIRLSRLDERGKPLSMAALARLAGTSPQQIERLEKSDRKFTREWAERLAPHLGVTAKELMFDGDAESSLRPANLAYSHVRGETAAGRWFEQDELNDEDKPLIPLVPGRFSGLAQFAFKVIGVSMDLRKINNGDYVICVNYYEAREHPLSGDIVVVERRRGQLTERTCKELELTNGGFLLWPRSTDKRFQKPIFVANKTDAVGDDGTEIEIVALVIGCYSPF